MTTIAGGEIGVACSNDQCNTPFNSCTAILRNTGKPCCGRCAYTATHRQRRLTDEEVKQMKRDATVAEVAEKAREAFFAEVFKHMPAGTTGDFPPDADVAFEQAAQDAVRTIMRNRPTKKYLITYEVEWQPTGDEGADDDGPMDATHSLECTDERFVGYALVAIDADYARHARDVIAYGRP